MQITIAITLPYHQFKEWSKENVKTRTARSRTREGNSIRSQCAYILVKRFWDEFHLCRHAEVSFGFLNSPQCLTLAVHFNSVFK
ncbi:hypothetical protein T05_5521 [Trichinella murrelli]|uniref:Uncharacterized protein n=1 Tax=Trichinella murrelli TaxID=144512 RepID=A0A0V0TCJ2_9BILA|nr:hypothetical protein T05_5521 [Trichinella murrelli]